jgi:hypothetical protein
MTGNQWASVLTVSIFDEAGTSGRRIRVSAGQVKEHSTLFNTSKSAETPNDQGIGDAKALLNACGTGEITQQALSTYSAATQG